MKEKSLIEFQSEEDALYHAKSYDAEKTKPEYDALSVKYGINKNELKIMHYNQFDKYKPLKRTADLISMIERLGKRNK